jgi:hypothetical protein
MQRDDEEEGSSDVLLHTSQFTLRWGASPVNRQRDAGRPKKTKKFRGEQPILIYPNSTVGTIFKKSPLPESLTRVHFGPATLPSLKSFAAWIQTATRELSSSTTG